MYIFLSRWKRGLRGISICVPGSPPTPLRFGDYDIAVASTLKHLSCMVTTERSEVSHLRDSRLCHAGSVTYAKAQEKYAKRFLYVIYNSLRFLRFHSFSTFPTPEL